MFKLHWQPPYDWEWMLGFLAARAVAGIEEVSASRYVRSYAFNGYQGLITAEPDEACATLNVTLSDGLLPVADHCLARIRALFDLDCSPQLVNEALGSLGAMRPGIRLPGCVDPFEQGVRAILGQLVSVAMAAKLTAKVASRYGSPLNAAPGFVCFPRADQLAQANPDDLKALGMPLKRAQALVFLAKSTCEGVFPLTLPEDVEQGIKMLQTWPGIGRWTASYFAMRGWQAKDIFLPDDYAIKQRFAGMTPAETRRYAERWQPWRSYALLHIWYCADWAPVNK
ncbi:DNA-3-methyladenine glycosylase 2 [Vagococcus sp. WN89Y]|uniref:DNA-3-methyladenine glycosylase 2 n=1 Tax=Vagococcus sp. WN89Y TaxID=3457258 RepID=UPI003FCECEE4